MAPTGALGLNCADNRQFSALGIWSNPGNRYCYGRSACVCDRYFGYKPNSDRSVRKNDDRSARRVRTDLDLAQGQLQVLSASLRHCFLCAPTAGPALGRVSLDGTIRQLPSGQEPSIRLREPVDRFDIHAHPSDISEASQHHRDRIGVHPQVDQFTGYMTRPLAGFPTSSDPAGASRVTVEPAETLLRRPIVLPGVIVQ
jgi:hypothetical protein